MKLARVRLKNFRCYRSEIAIDIGNITTIVGKNDAGKSTILEALKIFFDDEKPDSDDASVGGDKADVRITCEFDDLPQKIVIDSDFETSLDNEFLLNSDGRLEIQKVYSCKAAPKLVGIFAKAMHPTAAGVSDLLQLKLADLKARAKELSIPLEDVAKTVKAAVRKKIWSSTSDLKLQDVAVPLGAEGAKDLWEQLQKGLPVFALFKSDRASTDQDAEAQDPMRMAVKEALKQKVEELSAITRFVEAEVRAIAERTVSKICEMDPDLAKQLTPEFVAPKWDSVFKMSLTGDDQIPVNKRGSGVRRLILLNFFRAKAEHRTAESESGQVIYAIEEPETSQHPHNQRLLVQAFQELSEQPNCQVILTTHTPMLGRLLPDDSLRYIDHTPGTPRSVHHDHEATRRNVAKALGVLPDHQVRIFIGVEGRHDINFLVTIASVLRNAGDAVPDLQLLESEGALVFVPLGGSNLGLWTSRLAGLNRPEFYICDRDHEPPAVAKYDAFITRVNQRHGCRARCTMKREMENYLHSDAIAAAALKLHQREVRIAFRCFDDVPKLVAQSLHSTSGSPKAWIDLDPKKQEEKVSNAKRWLNKEAVAEMTPALLDDRDPNGDLRSWFKDIAEMMG